MPSENKETAELLTAEILIDAFSLPPEDAMKFFEEKGIKLASSYKDTLKFARTEAFTVTGVMKLDILQDFYDMLMKAQQDGETQESFKKNIKEKLEKKGWLGKKISDKPGQENIDTPWRLNLIYRQNLQTNFMAGKWAWAKATIKDFPYIEFQSVLDPSTTAICRFKDGKAMKISDKQINKFLTPSHYFCRASMESLRQEDVDNEFIEVLVGKDNLKHQNMKGFDKGLENGFKPDFAKYNPALKKLAKKKLK